MITDSAGNIVQPDNTIFAKAIVYYRDVDDGSGGPVKKIPHGPFRSRFKLLKVRTPGDPRTASYFQRSIHGLNDFPDVYDAEMDDVDGDFSPYNGNPAVGHGGLPETDGVDHVDSDFKAQNLGLHADQQPAHDPLGQLHRLRAGAGRVRRRHRYPRAGRSASGRLPRRPHLRPAAPPARSQCPIRRPHADEHRHHAEQLTTWGAGFPFADLGPECNSLSARSSVARRAMRRPTLALPYTRHRGTGAWCGLWGSDPGVLGVWVGRNMRAYVGRPDASSATRRIVGRSRQPTHWREPYHAGRKTGFRLISSQEGRLRLNDRSANCPIA